MKSRLSSSIACAAFTLVAAAPAGAANLNHYYDFQSGVIDMAGTQNGALFGSATVAGGVLNLGGNGDYAEFATNTFLVPNAGSYSVALFAKGSVTQASTTELISQGQAGGPGFYIGTDGSGASMRVTDVWPVTNVPFGAAGVWTHYALVVDAGANPSTTLYINGGPAASLPGVAITTLAAGTSTRLGAQFGNAGEYFVGALDEVRIYDGVLTPQEVASLASGVPEPASWLTMAAGVLAVTGGALRRCHRAARPPGDGQ
jgi:hypothetical protein